MLNEHFLQNFNHSVPPLLSEDSQLTLDGMAVLLSCLSTEGEILQLLQNLDVSKSNGPDGISATMLKGTSCSIASSLTKTIQYLNSVRLCPLWLEIIYGSPNPQGWVKIHANQL